MQEFVDEALRKGFHTLGFSPHSPVPIESPCNMSASDVDIYLAEIQRLRQYAGDRMKILAGMEIDYLGDRWGPASRYFASLPLDYRIGSVHFIPGPDDPAMLVDIDGNFARFNVNMHTRFHNDIRYVVDTFYTRSLSMIEAGGFDIIGHLDKIGRNASLFSPGIEDELWYKAHVERLVDAIASTGITVEINTKIADTTGRTFPRERFLTLVHRAGVPTIINTDSHRAELIDAGSRYGHRLNSSVQKCL